LEVHQYNNNNYNMPTVLCTSQFTILYVPWRVVTGWFNQGLWLWSWRAVGVGDGSGWGVLRDVSGTVPDGAAAVAATRVCAPSPVFPQLSCCSFVRRRVCRASPKNHNFFYDRLRAPSLISIFTVIAVCKKCMSEKFFNDMLCTLSDGSVLWYAQS